MSDHAKVVKAAVEAWTSNNVTLDTVSDICFALAHDDGAFNALKDRVLEIQNETTSGSNEEPEAVCPHCGVSGLVGPDASGDVDYCSACGKNI